MRAPASDRTICRRHRLGVKSLRAHVEKCWSDPYSVARIGVSTLQTYTSACIRGWCHQSNVQSVRRPSARCSRAHSASRACTVARVGQVTLSNPVPNCYNSAGSIGAWC